MKPLLSLKGEEKMTKRFAVIDRHGFFGHAARVYSAHATETAAIKAAGKHRVSIPGNQPNQSSAMVIQGTGGFEKGDTIYGDTIGRGRLYPVVW
jgi:hypothetical protein